MKILETIPYERNVIIEREQFHIDSHRKEFKGRCCNISDASFGDALTHHPRKDEIIKKMSATISRNMRNITKEERKQKFGNPGSKNGMYGKTHTDEVKRMLREIEYTKEIRDRMSKSAIRKFEKNPHLKENLSVCASQRTGDKNPFYGKSHTLETKERISKSNKGRKPPNRTSIEINGKKYESYGDASKELGIGVTTIRWRCLSENEKFKEYKILN
jgi:group I intron endonuclease